MGLVIDTCVFIAMERNDSLDFSDFEDYGEVYISAITASELLYGVHQANSKSRKLKRSAFVEAILKSIAILDFTEEIARLHAEVDYYLSKKGMQIGAHDLIIAATAIGNGAALLTSNVKEFKRVPGLKVLSMNSLLTC